MNTKVEISKILKKLGVSPDQQGYPYLREAIEMVMGDEAILHKYITKILYPTIAQRYNTTSARVERAMRHSIETSVLKVDLDLYADIFGGCISADKGKPTNSQFIGCVADYLVLSQETAGMPDDYHFEVGV